MARSPNQPYIDRTDTGTHTFFRLTLYSSAVPWVCSVIFYLLSSPIFLWIFQNHMATPSLYFVLLILVKKGRHSLFSLFSPIFLMLI